MTLPDEPYVDVSLFCGPYPFRALPGRTPTELARLLAATGAEAAVVTPFPALFYTQTWQGLREWQASAPSAAGVRYWAVLNPAYPGWERDLDGMLGDPGVAGIRLFPRYHGYGFGGDLSALLEVANRTAAAGRPLNLTARLLDDRLHPRLLHVDPPLDLSAVAHLLAGTPGTTWVLSGFYAGELHRLFPPVREHPAAYLDIGCVKPPEFWWETVVAEVGAARLLVGTGAPLYYYGGTRLSLARADLAPEARALLLRENARRLFFPERTRAADH
ncbi:MAG: hypothetical protein FJX77_00910 [Armatimonadetes bacterium]|nr:hypothetical protein [Armatimonadota bacterium]